MWRRFSPARSRRTFPKLPRKVAPRTGPGSSGPGTSTANEENTCTRGGRFRLNAADPQTNHRGIGRPRSGGARTRWRGRCREGPGTAARCRLHGHQHAETGRDHGAPDDPAGEDLSGCHGLIAHPAGSRDYLRVPGIGGLRFCRQAGWHGLIQHGRRWRTN